MKKTIPTSLAGALFHIEEDAYAKLDGYLSSIRSHFASNPDKEEIIRDIESRIAEKFIESTGGIEKQGERIITDEYVAKIIASMGMPDDFADGENEGEKEEEKGVRKLYRDPDAAAIGGVSSGLGAFFGIDPLWFRLAFIASIFAGGTGIIIYIILWLAVPEAKNASQKLEMSGTRVTLESVKGVVNERIIEAKARRGKLAEFLRSLMGLVTKRIIPLLGKIIGVIVNIAVVIGLVALISGLLIATIYPDKLLSDPIVRDMVSGPVYYASLITLFMVVAIPLFFLGALGALFMGRKNPVAGKLGGILTIFWLLAIISAIVIGFALGDKYERFEATDARLQEVTKITAVEPFVKLETLNGQSVIYELGQEYKVTLRGRESDIEEIDRGIVNGVLTVRRDDNNVCFLCISRPVTITVTSPGIESIRAWNSASATVAGNGTLVSAEAGNGSRITLKGAFRNISVKAENASRLDISGTAELLDAEIVNGSRLEAEGLTSSVVKIGAANASKAEVNADLSLEATARNASRIYQFGKAPLTQSTSDVSSSVMSGNDDTR